MRILVVEDDPTLREGLTDLLRGDGHDVTAIEDGAEAIKVGTAETFDMAILDVMVPSRDGFEVCAALRQAKPALGIVMLTAKGSEDDKVRGLSAGADDYVTKPFGARELLARVTAMGRRAAAMPADAETIEADGCVFDLNRCEARRGEDVTTLTPREAGIIRWLHRHRGRAVPRAELLEQLWAVPGDLETRTVDMTIANLRKKVERDHKEPKIIHSVKGVGYIWGQN